MDQWHSIVISIVGPAVSYFNERINEPSGDRFKSFQLFEAASLFDPYVAKNTAHDCAMEKLEYLRHYPALNKEGEENIVDRLKRGWGAFRQNTMYVPKEFDYKKDKAAILSWHYSLYLRLDKELREDSRARKSCRYCGCREAKCHCNCNLRSYWEAAQLLSLVMPSSGAAERVFSLLDNLFNKQQTCTLGDMLYLSLFLAYNDRMV